MSSRLIMLVCNGGLALELCISRNIYRQGVGIASGPLNWLVQNTQLNKT